MNRFFQAFAIAAVAMGLISPFIAESGSRSHPLDEDAALDLLQRTLKSDSIYEKRISADCIAYGTEETTNAYFGFVLREIHNAKCGGDPDVTPAIGFIDVPAKSRGGIRLKTNGSHISPREASSGFRDLLRTQVAPAVTGAILISYR